MSNHEGGGSRETPVQGVVRGHQDGPRAGLASPPRLLQAERPARAPLRVRLRLDLTTRAHRLRRLVGLEAVAGGLIGAGVQASGLVPTGAAARFVVGVFALAVVAGRVGRRWGS